MQSINKNWVLLVWVILGLHLSAQAQQVLPTNENVHLWVDGACGMCAQRIEKAALTLPGIQTAQWDTPSKTLYVKTGQQPPTLQQLQDRLAQAGHDTEGATAPQAIYDALHFCCQYRTESPDEDEPEEHGTNDSQTGIVTGLVLTTQDNGSQSPLIGASVQWLNTSKGTTTDAEGRFSLPIQPDQPQLVISYVGYPPDTFRITQPGDYFFELSGAYTIDEVEVTHRNRSTEVSFLEAGNLQTLSERELTKAACCSLAESFETTPAIDASATDAVTGTRKIAMLGLASPYLQITRENMPDVRGLAAIHGMEYTAGAWVEGIQLNTGAGSVVNGFESITGQINVELWKPESADPLYLNLYGNRMGRLEGNLSTHHHLNEDWHTGLLLHAKYQQLESDRNADGFLDNPLSTHLIGIHRWRFTGGSTNWQGQAGIRGAYIEDRSGQVPGTDSPWTAQHNDRLMEGWLKTAYMFPGRPYASAAIQLSAKWHQNESRYGLRPYEGEQTSAYANLIYKDIISDTRHNFRTGASFQWDRYDELLGDQRYTRNEWVPGAYFEYTYGKGFPFTAVAGLRADYHNNFGGFLTPRLNLRYAFNEQLVWRASGGRGQRTASIFAENIGFLASSRTVIVQDEHSDLPYGLEAEVAWNMGTTLNYEFPAIGGRAANLALSYFHTRFQNQIVVDYDESPQEVYFYNLDGQSFSNSALVQLDIDLTAHWEARLAYRFNDVQTDYQSGRLEKPLVSRHRAFLNTAYETDSGWKFDATLSLRGAQRLPSTRSNPAEYRLDDYSPSFLLLSGQITKVWGRKWEVYLGGENLLDYRQENPILAADDPFGEFFDASMVWGPIFGRNVYVGMRYRLALSDN